MARKKPRYRMRYQGVSIGLWSHLCVATSRICDNFLKWRIGKSLFLVKAVQILAHLVHICFGTDHGGAEHQELGDKHQHRPIYLPGRWSVKASGREQDRSRQGNK